MTSQSTIDEPVRPRHSSVGVVRPMVTVIDDLALHEIDGDEYVAHVAPDRFDDLVPDHFPPAELNQWGPWL